MTNIYVVPQPRFPFGELYVTYPAEQTISTEDIEFALKCHANGDWGDVCDEDREENERALIEGRRLFSAYTDRNSVKFWIITESDRSATTVLLPDDY